MYRKSYYAGFVLASCIGLSVVAAPCHASSVANNYHHYCVNCHGEDGSGNGPAAAVLDKSPTSFSDCATMKAQAPEVIAKIISEGGAAVGRSPQMPGHAKRLSPVEIDALAHYVADHFCEDE